MPKESTMDPEPADPQALQPLLPVQTRAPTGCGSTSMDPEPAGLGVQPPPPSVPSCPGVDEPSKHLARMIALGGYDPSMVDDVHFRCFLSSLNPEFTMPSRVKIEQECDRIFDEARRDLLSRLSTSHGGDCLAVGRTKIFDKDVMYIACHFIDDEWVLRKLVLDAFLVEDDRYVKDDRILGVKIIDSDDLLDGLAGIMSHHGVSNRVSMLTSGRYYEEYLCMKLKDIIQLRLLSDTSTRAVDISCAIYVDKLLHTIAQYFLSAYARWNINRSEELEQLIHLTREERQQLISHLDLDDPWMYPDEDWYVMFCSLKILRMESSNATETNSFGELLSKVCERKHYITIKYDDYPSDFFCMVWEKIHHAIRTISTPSYPTSHLCLKVLLNMRMFLKSIILPQLSIHRGVVIAITDCLNKAINTLDEEITDRYLVWAIPLALDPRYKLSSIFQEAFDPVVATRYYSKVTKRITDLYHDYRKDEVRTRSGAGHSDSGVAVAVAAGADDGDDPMHQSGCPAEWTRYICDPTLPVEEDSDILKWWKGNSEKYPILARMARDTFSMPTCSKPTSDEIAQIRSIIRGYSRPSSRRF